MAETECIYSLLDGFLNLFKIITHEKIMQNVLVMSGRNIDRKVITSGQTFSYKIGVSFMVSIVNVKNTFTMMLINYGKIYYHSGSK